MSTRERIVHMVLFEAVALIIMVLLALLFTGKDPLSLTGLAISLSLIAMAWNYFYNVLFDRYFGSNRMNRGLWLRIGHGIGFELGFIFVSVPLVMWALNMSLLAALLLDIGAIVFFTVYAIAFNWVYDLVRYRYAAT